MVPEHQHEALVAPPPPTPKHELNPNFGGHPLPSAAAPLTLAPRHPPRASTLRSAADPGPTSTLLPHPPPVYCHARPVPHPPRPAPSPHARLAPCPHCFPPALSRPCPHPRPRGPRPHDVCVPLLLPYPPLLLRTHHLASVSPRRYPVPAHLVDTYATPFPARHVPLTPSPCTHFRIASNTVPSVLPPLLHVSLPYSACSPALGSITALPGQSDPPRWCSHYYILHLPPPRPPISPFPPYADPHPRHPPSPLSSLFFPPRPRSFSPPTYFTHLSLYATSPSLYFYSLLTQYKTIEPAFCLTTAVNSDDSVRMPHGHYFLHKPALDLPF
ncbi:hypothetical protein DFH08DRAFT_950692 [Mycena albidolilacea]|uniref:Uncharacterized protein n=1 Tax=Mycena albidolilacea TaxID=1033008 RepID=A0AAD7F205_9AGAR|nr:hypothetical protein DFH08DRAFT_950692 [Mycena albidolilacea]